MVMFKFISIFVFLLIKLGVFEVDIVCLVVKDRFIDDLFVLLLLLVSWVLI